VVALVLVDCEVVADVVVAGAIAEVVTGCGATEAIAAAVLSASTVDTLDWDEGCGGPERELQAANVISKTPVVASATAATVASRRLFVGA